MKLIQGKYGYASNSDMKTLFGLQPENHWPKGGIPAHIIQGVKVWVKPAQEPKHYSRYDNYKGCTVIGTIKQSNHRVMMECPDCKAVFSVGRQHQHKCR